MIVNSRLNKIVRSSPSEIVSAGLSSSRIVIRYLCKNVSSGSRNIVRSVLSKIVSSSRSKRVSSGPSKIIKSGPSK